MKALTALLVSSVVMAQPAPRPPLVVLRSVTPPSPALEASLAEMVRRLGLQLVATVTSDGVEPLAIVEVDLTSGQVLVDSPSRKVTIRRALAPELVGEVRQESAATLVASAVDVLLHTDPPRQPVPIAVPPPESVTAPAPRPLSPVGLDVGIGLGPKLSGGTAAVDFAATAHALVTLPLGTQLPGLLATIGFQPGLDLEGTALTFRGQLFSARLFAQLELFRWRFGRLEAGAGGGLDLFSFASFQREGELLRPMMARRLAASPIVSGLLTYRFPVGESVHLFATFTLDGDLRAARPPRDRPVGEQNDPQPWTVKPMLQLGVSFAPFRARE